LMEWSCSDTRAGLVSFCAVLTCVEGALVRVSMRRRVIRSLRIDQDFVRDRTLLGEASLHMSSHSEVIWVQAVVCRSCT
jgi:hypothetical protein